MTSSIVTCAQCSMPATMRCGGCSDAPAYNECISKATFYCGTKCQIDHRRQHKSECRKLQTRKRVQRAAMLLQAIFYRIRTHAYPLQFSSTRTESSTLYLNGLQYADVHTHLGPLPDCLDTHRDAILAYMGCTEAMRYLYIFAKAFLDGFCFKIEEVSVSVINHKLTICPVLPGGNQMKTPESLCHSVYRTTLKNGEIWAIDVTGAQFGYTAPLSSWQEFEQRRVSKIIKEYELGYLARRALGPIYAVSQLERQELRQMIEARVPAWSQDCGANFNALLVGSDSASTSATDRFLEQFEKHVKTSMTDLLSSKNVARRSRDCEREFPLNINDPNRRKQLKGLIEFMNAAIDLSPLSRDRESRA